MLGLKSDLRCPLYGTKILELRYSYVTLCVFYRLTYQFLLGLVTLAFGDGVVEC